MVEPFYTNYLRLRGDGRRDARAAARPRRGRLPPAADRRSGRRRSRPARGSCCSATPTTRPAPSTRATRSTRWPAFCREHGLFLVSDEVYREFVYDGRSTTSVLAPAGLRGPRGRSSTACRSATAPAASGSAAWRRATASVYGAVLRMAQGRLSPPGPRAARRARGRRARATTTRTASCASTRRAATCCSRA